MSNIWYNGNLWEGMNGESPPEGYRMSDRGMSLDLSGGRHTLNYAAPIKQGDFIQFKVLKSPGHVSIIDESSNYIGGAWPGNEIDIDLSGYIGESIKISVDGGYGGLLEIEGSGAFATVRITVLGEDTCPRNWWLCCPKPEPDPIPERPTDFVPLDQYDLEFTYPLKSSRKPSRNPLQDGCVNCGPVFVSPAPPVPDPEPEPEPELVAHMEVYCSIDEMIYGVYWEDLEGNHVNKPSWWNPNTEFTLKWGSWEGIYSDVDTIIGQEGTPPECCNSLDPYGILRQGDNTAYFNVVWFCG